MSFYLDEDDEDEAFGQVFSSARKENTTITNNNASTLTPLTQGEHAGFVCDNCGGTESYLDDTSGGLVCVDCFTQSQTMIAASQELMDYDESMALAGRVSGHFKTTVSSSSSKGRRKTSRKRKRLAELDHSSPLPSVEHCILGMQRLLKETVSIVADKKIKFGKKRKEIRSAAMETARTVWKAYLSSWMEGANYYGALYPEVRFCFRDLFLSTYFRMRLLRVLTHEASRKVREEIINDVADPGKGSNHDHDGLNGGLTTQESEKTSNENGFVYPDIEIVQKEDNSGGEEEDEDEISRSVTQTGGNQQGPTGNGGDGLIKNPIARMLIRHQKLTGKKTMGRKSVALSLSPSLQMVAAILCMAFAPFGVTCADIQVWIEDGSLPLLNAFPLLTPQEQKHLKQIKGFFRLHEPPPALQLEKLAANLQVACGYEPKTLIVRQLGSETKQEETSRRLIQTNKIHQGRLFTPRSLPLILARIVAQLGLSQKVLDYSLAMMGLPILIDVNAGSSQAGDGQIQLPKPLRACRSDRVRGMPELLGVVVTASKFIDKWEDHWYVVPSTNDKGTFVPWNESLARHLGSFSKEHLDLLENHLIDIGHPVFFDDDELNTSSSSDHRDAVQENDKSFASRAVVPCPILLRAKTRQCRRGKVALQGIVWENNSSIKGVVPGPPSGTLVEYVSSKTGTKARDVLRFCNKLEEEMQQKNRDR